MTDKGSITSTDEMWATLRDAEFEQRGATAERAAVVRYLRQEGLVYAASEIENGEHLKEAAK